MIKPQPIFVRGMSRSGGTLVVTLLDAHPDVAMSYELYPNVLRRRVRDVANLIDAHLDERDSFADVEGRLRFIERCAMEKMQREGKKRWGLKCNNNYRQYLSLWPNAQFLNLLRDGRGVVASQRTTGAFTQRRVPLNYVYRNLQVL